MKRDDEVVPQELEGIDRAALLRRITLGGAAVSLPALYGAQAAFAGSDGLAALPKHPKWKFAFINHVTTNPFFVPTQYGAADAAALVNVSYTWGGSTKADVGEMINAFNAAISAKADGIAVCVVDKGAFEAPIKRALRRGIPVLAYNADGARAGAKARMSYVGQALYESGFAMGVRIATMVPKGDVALFIATPGALNIQPRIDGAMAAIKQSGKPINPKIVATDADLSKELAAIDAYYLGHKNADRHVRGRRRRHPGRRADHPEVQPERESGRRRVRPPARHAQVGRSRLPELHDRPAAVPAGLLPGAAALPLQAVQRPGGTLRHQHRTAVRHEGERQAVPHDEVAVRRLLIES